MFRKVLFCIFLLFFLNSLFSLENKLSPIDLLSFDTTFQSYYPLERYALYSKYNYGISTQLNMGINQIKPLRIFTSISFSNNVPAVDTIKSIYDLYFVIGTGWRFNMDKALPFDGLSITPGIGYGWMPHLTNGTYWSKGEEKFMAFQDQIIMTQIEFEYELKNLIRTWDIILLFTPSYVHFVEEEYDGQEIGFNIGFRMPLDKKKSKNVITNKPKIKVEPLASPVNSVPPGISNNKDQRVNDITPTSALITVETAEDDDTPSEKLLYKVKITSADSEELIYEGESIGDNTLAAKGLPPNTEFISHVSVEDADGNISEYSSKKFKTLSMVNDNSFNLGKDAIEVDLRKILEVEFNSDLNETTITPESVYVKSGNKIIQGELRYNNRILEFVPLEDFVQGEQHSFVLTTGIKDSNGFSLKEDAEFYFTALDYNDIFAHWKFDNNTYDSSGNNHTATLKSVKTDKKPEFVDIDDKGNGGLHFVGGYNWGTYIDLGTIDMGDTFTIAGWVFIEKPPVNYSQKIMTLISNGDAGAKKDGFKVFFNNWNRDDRRIVIETGNKAANRNSETQENFTEYDNWYHVAVVIDRTTGIVKLYFNGKEASTTNGGSILNDFNTNAPLHIGHFKDGYFHYNGYIDDFRIYKKTISAEDIEVIARRR